MQLVDGVLNLGELTLAPVEAGQRRPVRAVLGHIRARDVEELHEELAGEERQAAALRETDLRHLARDDDLVGPVGGGADDGGRLVADFVIG